MTGILIRYGPAEDIQEDKGTDFFISDAFKISDPAYIAFAMGVVAGVKGLKKLQKKQGVQSSRYTDHSMITGVTHWKLLCFE